MTMMNNQERVKQVRCNKLMMISKKIKISVKSLRRVKRERKVGKEKLSSRGQPNGKKLILKVIEE